MEAYYAGSWRVDGQGMTDHGFFTRDSFGRFENVTHEVEKGNLYRVEVYRVGDGLASRLTSGGSIQPAYVNEELKLESHGLRDDLHLAASEPQEPRKWDEPRRGIEAFSRYTLDHACEEGLEMNDEAFDWTSLMDEENAPV